VNIHYGAVRREPWMGKSMRWMYVDGHGITRSMHFKPSKAEVQHECRGAEHVDVFKVVTVTEPSDVIFSRLGDQQRMWGGHTRGGYYAKDRR
jgi:hypothetical protein